MERILHLKTSVRISKSVRCPLSSCASQSEENISGMTSFREVLEKMLVIVVLPVRNSLRRENELFSSHLVSNTCGLLASIVSELTASALGSEVRSSISQRVNKHMYLQNGYPVSLSHNIKVRHSPLFRRFLRESPLDLPPHLPKSPLYSNFFVYLAVLTNLLSRC